MSAEATDSLPIESSEKTNQSSALDKLTEERGSLADQREALETERTRMAMTTSNALPQLELFGTGDDLSGLQNAQGAEAQLRQLFQDVQQQGNQKVENE